MLDIDSQDIPGSFRCIAKDLFNNHLIHVNQNRYRLLEIEFYYKPTKDHDDNYSHQHDQQKRSGFWYVHPSGIDLTFGDDKAYGGILLRAIQKIQSSTEEENPTFFGPLNVQTEIFSGFNSAIDGAPNVFNLVPAMDAINAIHDDEIIDCQRIGLNPNRADANAFHTAPYRFLILPHLMGHKGKTQIAEKLYEKWGTNTAALDRIKTLFKGEYLNKYR